MNNFADSPSGFQSPASSLPIAGLRWFLRRIVFGILFAAPILLTLFVVSQTYSFLNFRVFDPVASFIAPLIVPKGIYDSYWTTVEKYVTPPISLLTVLMIFYILGYAFQSRLSRWVDWGFSYIPGISVLYRAVRDASQAMQGPDGLKKIDTVVLVPFPHAGARATGFLMGECQDFNTGRQLACVYVPIGLFPPSGYTLIFPREDIIQTGWEATSPWKLLLTGGLTIPQRVPFDGVVKPKV